MKPGMRQLVEDAEVWSLEALLCLKPSASLDQMQIHTAGVLTPNQWRSSHRESSQFNPVQLAGLRPTGRAHGAGDPGRHGGALCRGHLWEMPTSFLQCLSVDRVKEETTPKHRINTARQGNRELQTLGAKQQQTLKPERVSEAYLTRISRTLQVLVSSPSAAQELHSPVIISGCQNVPEATLSPCTIPLGPQLCHENHPGLARGSTVSTIYRIPGSSLQPQFNLSPLELE
ncbi:hypothetical protein MJG53_011684 [Ovis ammon polii x Ovis aries]|uniref:Uncharacterized protein n=1 Tax=Ovis ammon polii x Ovis aries TaxID=2918886 RepID=A0ACB9UPC6_9CETA|nr:hypothetical protein MJG53_011684 [Ovis ammon polii x Ovis aries]